MLALNPNCAANSQGSELTKFHAATHGLASQQDKLRSFSPYLVGRTRGEYKKASLLAYAMYFQ